MPRLTSRKPLTASFVRAVEHGGGAGHDKHSDGNGLLLQVTPSGRKQWLQRITLDGQRRDYGLGGYPAVGLKEARAQAQANLAEARAYRLAVHRGDQPPPLLPGFERGRLATLRQRKKLNGTAVLPAAESLRHGLTFGQCFEACVDERAKGWKNPATDRRSWRASLRDHLAPIAERHVAQITVDDLRAIFTDLPPKTVDKVLRRTGTVFEWAVAGGHRPDNPARRLRATWRGLSNGNGGPARRKAMP